MALAFVSCVFRAFVKGAIMFIGGAIMLVEGAMIFIGGAVTLIEGAVMFIGSAIRGRSFKAAGVGVVNDIKGVDECDLRRRLITYELKGPLLLMCSLIS